MGKDRVLVPAKSKQPSHPRFDALRVAVQFYRNHGALRQVHDRSGVSIAALERFANTGEISPRQRELLEQAQEKTNA